MSTPLFVCGHWKTIGLNGQGFDRGIRPLRLVQNLLL
jgi:hypothetical protein